MFQLPALLLQGMTIVVSPLKTLMSDWVFGLLRKKMPATFVKQQEKDIQCRGLARALLDAVFSSKPPVRRFRYCCDQFPRVNHRFKSLSVHVTTVFAKRR